jgi:hypothetical protein
VSLFMSETLTGSRLIAPGISVATGDGAPVVPSRSISEAEIHEFCGNCKFHQPDNSCSRVETRVTEGSDQARYVDRRWCGWASVKGIRGRMTGNGFVALASGSDPSLPADNR